MDRTCIVKGCSQDPVCQDTKNYVKYRSQDPLSGSGPSFDYDEGALEGDREIWFCQEHAKDFLFPLIEQACGYTTQAIVQESVKQGLWK